MALMIKPAELESEDNRGVWEVLTAAAGGDVATLRHWLAQDSRLSRAGYWYLPAVHFAVREGHADAARLLFASGADPERNGWYDGSLIEMARERGHDDVARVVEEARQRCGRVLAQPGDHPIHAAAIHGDAEAVRTLLDADPNLVNLGDQFGATALHRAVLCGSRAVVALLLDRGADVHALGSKRVLDVQAIDVAIWGATGHNINPDMAALLVSHGATYDVTIAAALGDMEGVRRMLDESPARIRETRPKGRRPLSTALEFGHDGIARLLLDRGADPKWDEPDAPHGTALHVASRMGNLAMVELLLAHGADPNEDIDSAASALTFAATPEIRALLESYGAGVGDYDTTWIEHDDERLRRVAANPSDTYRIGVAFTMCADRPDLLARLLGAGLRMPAVHTSCQGYLLNLEALRTLLAHGMSPDQMNWLRQTLLHLACDGNKIEQAAILLDAGANITARDDDYRSTPLGWAARRNAPEMVQLLLSRGAPVNLPDDEPWATPLAWATRRSHSRVVEMLRAAGATESTCR